VTETPYGICTCEPDFCNEGNDECRLCDTIDGELPCPAEGQENES
jgi:hypothetical protein